MILRVRGKIDATNQCCIRLSRAPSASSLLRFIVHLRSRASFASLLLGSTTQLRFRAKSLRPTVDGAAFRNGNLLAPPPLRLTGLVAA
jgi:hypothetical protein